LATLVGVTRIVYGAHLPLDVVGGACLGIMIGCVVDLALLAVPLPRNEERA
jgi:membrane-associated phospholipid phosphatase